MLTFFVLFVLSITLAIYFFSSFKQKRIYSIIFGAAFLLACALFLFSIRVFIAGYPYRLQMDRESLKTLFIDLDTAQQYEEWFCPDERFVSSHEDEDYFYMRKTFKFEDEPYRYVNVKITIFCDSQTAAESIKLERKQLLGRMGKIRRVSTDYEYCFSRTRRDLVQDSHFAILLCLIWPADDYVSNVAIRYKNAVFEFTEFSDQRESRIDEVIDQLLADYERYLEEMNP